MNIDTKERLARWRDASDDAVAVRLRAARMAAGYLEQKDFAEALGVPKQTLNTQEVKGRPDRKTVQFLYRHHKIDFNFVFYGDFLQLPGDVQERLFSALDAAERSRGRTAS